MTFHPVGPSKSTALNSVDWLNVVNGYGADPTGVRDSTTAIQTALNAATSGQTVYMPAGVYVTSAPLVSPNISITLKGDTGAAQGGGGIPGVGSIIRPSASFAQGSAAVLAVIIGANGNRQSYEDFWIDGTNAASVVDLEGIDLNGSGTATSIYRVGLCNMSSWGLRGQSGLGLYLDTIIAQANGGNVSAQHLLNGAAGGIFINSSDVFHNNVHAQSNTGTGYAIRGGDHRLNACRADLSTTKGFDIGCFNASSSLGLGAILVNCGTQSNQQEGCYLSGGGHNTYGPFSLTNCQFTTDGLGGTFAAINNVGRIVTSLVDCEVSSDGTHPAYAVGTAQNSATAVPDLVTIDGGNWQVGTSFLNDAGPATKIVWGVTTQGVTGAITGGSGTTTFNNVHSPAASASFTPANPATTAVTTLIHAGFGVVASPVTYTPTGTGKVLVSATGVAGTNTAQVNMSVGGRYGQLAGSATTVAAGSNGGAAISTIASWAQPSAGVLDVASTTGYAASGTIWVTTSGANQPAQITYTSITGGGTPSFNGCVFVAGGNAGANTVATGNSVTGAPQNGAPVAGTRFGGATDQTIRGAAAGTGGNFVLQQIVTGLTVNQAYWFDVVYDTSAGADVAFLQSVNVSLAEQIT